MKFSIATASAANLPPSIAIHLCNLEMATGMRFGVSADSNTGLVSASAWIVKRALERRCSDCSATPQEALQVHQYEPQRYLRQSPCADFEANFIYLLIAPQSSLIDTGASPTRKRCLGKNDLDLFRKKITKSFTPSGAYS